MPSDFIKEQRELSRNATLWKAEEKPSATTTKPQANELAEEESEAKVAQQLEIKFLQMKFM